LLHAINENSKENVKAKAGRVFDSIDFLQKRKVALINSEFAKNLVSSEAINSLPGKHVMLNGVVTQIVGVLNDSTKTPEIFIPISSYSFNDFKASPPTVLCEVKNTSDVDNVKAEIKHWADENFKSSAADLEVITNEYRVEQATKGFMLFRVIMGLIVGISVLVGGIGVMNVLLISVTQRTTEIGVRKAVGAKRKDIVFQFLAEAVTISTLGSLCGLLLGVLGTMATIPIIKAITKVPFQASFTANTILIVVLIAIFVGIIFGTYPAMRASRLHPVEAMRRE